MHWELGKCSRKVSEKIGEYGYGGIVLGGNGKGVEEYSSLRGVKEVELEEKYKRKWKGMCVKGEKVCTEVRVRKVNMEKRELGS